MQNILIVGASRGIGLALTQVFLERGERVQAVVRRLENPALDALATRHPQRLELIVCDLTNTEAPSVIAKAVGNRELDIAVFNAGISGEQDVEKISQDEIATLFLTNAVAPLRVARALNPRLGAGAVIAFMSSQMGSVELARASDLPLYGASKAALNSLLRSWSGAADRPTACLLALHPGWVKTDMGGDNALLEVSESAAGLVATLESYLGSNGCHFVDYQQQTLPW